MRSTFEIYHTLVAQGSTILAEYSTPGVGANIGVITQSVLERLHGQQSLEDGSRMAFIHEKFWYLVLAQGGYTFLCIVDEKAPRHLMSVYLDDISAQFLRMFEVRLSRATPVAYEFNSEFRPVLKTRSEYYGQEADADQLERLKAKMGTVKEVMVENIEKVLERGERLDTLQTKTELLEEQGQLFRRRAGGLKRAMYWTKVKYTLLLLLILAFVAYVIFAIICGPAGGKCRK
eukprot:TRINITY_DN17848_c1_g1_i5.p3 TRINITY_DN17848_c1_g1~~TRINITY_DN17848_c1_g1_i5.p3  ORF type:complete len:232 (-),score=19.08 TRINITY_DN17848_c1_g1_i5:316-1011(-)